MKGKKRLTINIVAQMISFAVTIGVNFLLTPFIVEKLGTEAFGFIGLANNFVSYVQILTIALNSMAGRFIAIEYLQGNMMEAKKYYTSVFYANIFLATIVGLITIIGTLYLEIMINIPVKLICDVKLLFTLMMGNFMISLIFSVYGVATFIKNRLDYKAILSVFGNVLRAILLTAFFAFLTPKLWYIGCTTVICTTFIGFFEYFYKTRLTPELRTSTALYNNKFVFTVVKSGVWFSISRLSNIIEQGFDLLLANLFIGATAMGHLSITKQIPVFILSLIGTISSAFAPSLTESYARNDRQSIRAEILMSMKIIGFFSLIPLCFIFSFIDCFYSLWLPNEDSDYLYILTIIGILYFPILLSLEGVQNLWPVYNKVKTYSLASISFSFLTFITVLFGLYYINETYRIYYLICISTVYNLIFVLFFIPLFAARCLEVKKSFFYLNIFKTLVSLLFIVLILHFVKKAVIIDSWFRLSCMMALDILLCIVLGSYFILDKDDKDRIKARLLPLFRKMAG